MRRKVLILDSNSIFSPDVRKLVKPDVEEQLRECRKLYSIDVFVPRVALSEIAYRKCVASERLLAKSRNAAGNVAEILQIQVSNEPLNILPSIRFNLYRQYLRWCRNNGITIERLPVQAINWKRLVTEAIYRRPPFSDGESEKGFRDALILRSAVAVADRYDEPELTLITADDRLKQAVNQQAKWSTAESLEEYLSALKLEHSNVAAIRLEIFTTKASQVFFEPDNQNCLFQKANVLAIIRRMFADKLNAIPELNVLDNLVYFPDRTTLDRYGEDVVIVGPSLYQQTDSYNRHYWSATVVFLTLFEAQTKHLSGVCHDLFRRTVFNVVWCAFVSDRGEFSQEAVKDVSFSNSIMDRATVMDLATYGFPTRLGRLTQFAGDAEHLHPSPRARVIQPP